MLVLKEEGLLHSLFLKNRFFSFWGFLQRTTRTAQRKEEPFLGFFSSRRAGSFQEERFFRNEPCSFERVFLFWRRVLLFWANNWFFNVVLILPLIYFSTLKIYIRGYIVVIYIVVIYIGSSGGSCFLETRKESFFWAGFFKKNKKNGSFLKNRSEQWFWKKRLPSSGTAPLLNRRTASFRTIVVFFCSSETHLHNNDMTTIWQRTTLSVVILIVLILPLIYSSTLKIYICGYIVVI